MTKVEYLKQIEEFADSCACCSGKNQPYMVHDHIWETAFPKPPMLETMWAQDPDTGKFERVPGTGFFACLPCLEKNLGRDLTTDDFTDAPINFGIFGFDCLVYCQLEKEA